MWPQSALIEGLHGGSQIFFGLFYEWSMTASPEFDSRADIVWYVNASNIIDSIHFLSRCHVKHRSAERR